MKPRHLRAVPSDLAPLPSPVKHQPRDRWTRRELALELLIVAVVVLIVALARWR